MNSRAPDGIAITRDFSLASGNTLRLPASAAHYTCVRDTDELAAALGYARANGLAVMPLGEGSNVVLAGDIDALVLQPALTGIDITLDTGPAIRLRIGAGENWHRLVEWSLGRQYCGLENLALIPGTVGAAPIQNIGAYGVELDEVLTRVHAVSVETGEAVQLSRDECAFAYRDSIFKHELRDQLVITAVEMELFRVPRIRADYPALAEALDARGITMPSTRDVFDAVVAVRSSKLPDPATEPNAGSFFKNPIVAAEAAHALQAQHPGMPCYAQDNGVCKLSAAWMIDQLGWKGRRSGAFGVHPQHALVMVHHQEEGGNGAQLLEFAAQIAGSVRDAFGVTLDIEPRVYGAAA